MNSSAPVRVSVCLVTYNHEAYIAQAIESVLMQETEFEFELLITEDCSTDGTRDILADYERRHPGRIRLFLSPENLCTNEVFSRAAREARGEYVAVLDGDDYWTSPLKLQKQVEFLDAHPECSMCFHNVMRVHEDPARPDFPHTPEDLPQSTGLEEILRFNYVAGCSPMLRRSVLESLPDGYEGMIFGDWPLYVRAAELGRIGFLPEFMGVYRIHAGGIWTATSRATQNSNLLRFYEELNQGTGGRHAELIAEPFTTWYLRLVEAQLKAASPEDARRIPPVLEGRSRPRWSVMIPTYECGDTLRETLESVLAQDPGPDHMQIEVVDDASGEDPRPIVEEVGQGRVGYFRHPENVGHVRNFNTCLQRARGELVHLLHGDDRVEPGFHARMETAFTSRPEVGAAFCTVGFIDEAGEPYAGSTAPQPESGLLEDGPVRLTSETPVYTPAMVVRRKVYEELGGFDPRFRGCGEDLEMWVRIASAHPVWFENEPLALYRRPLGANGKGITSRSLTTGANVRDVRRAFGMYSAYLPADRVPSVRARFRSRCADWALGHARGLLRAGALRGAFAQSREALRTEASFRVLARIGRMWGREGVRRARATLKGAA